MQDTDPAFDPFPRSDFMKQFKTTSETVQLSAAECVVALVNKHLQVGVLAVTVATQCALTVTVAIQCAQATLTVTVVTLSAYTDIDCSGTMCSTNINLLFASPS